MVAFHLARLLGQYWYAIKIIVEHGLDGTKALQLPHSSVVQAGYFRNAKAIKEHSDKLRVQSTSCQNQFDVILSLL